MNPAKMSALMILMLISIFLLLAVLPAQAETQKMTPVQEISVSFSDEAISSIADHDQLLDCTVPMIETDTIRVLQ